MSDGEITEADYFTGPVRAVVAVDAPGKADDRAWLRRYRSYLRVSLRAPVIRGALALKPDPVEHFTRFSMKRWLPQFS